MRNRHHKPPAIVPEQVEAQAEFVRSVYESDFDRVVRLIKNSQEARHWTDNQCQAIQDVIRSKV